MQPNSIPLFATLSCALAMGWGAADAQSPLEIYQQRVKDCMGDRNSVEYDTDICIAFRDGVIYARDALRQVPAGSTLTQYYTIPPDGEHVMTSQPDVVSPMDQGQLIDDAGSMILTVDPKSGAVSAAPVQRIAPAAIAPPSAPIKGPSPYIQQVR